MATRGIQKLTRLRGSPLVVVIVVAIQVQSQVLHERLETGDFFVHGLHVATRLFLDALQLFTGFLLAGLDVFVQAPERFRQF